MLAGYGPDNAGTEIILSKLQACLPVGFPPKLSGMEKKKTSKPLPKKPIPAGLPADAKPLVSVKPLSAGKTAAKQTSPVPPQLIGVYEDALRVGAKSFCLEPSGDAVMASFSVPGSAAEIDFEAGAGKEMIDWLRGQPPLKKGASRKLVLAYADHRQDCRVTADPKRGPQWLEVTWK